MRAGKVRMLILFLNFVISALIMTAAWWIYIVGRPVDTYTDPPYIAASAVIAFTFGVQAIAWNVLCRFPKSQIVRIFLGVGFPSAATLMALGVGNFADMFLSLKFGKFEMFEEVGVALVRFGEPAFHIGLS